MVDKRIEKRWRLHGLVDPRHEIELLKFTFINMVDRSMRIQQYQRQSTTFFEFFDLSG